MSFKSLFMASTGYGPSKSNAIALAGLGCLFIGIVLFDLRAYHAFTRDYVAAQAELIEKIDNAQAVTDRRLAAALKKRGLVRRKHIWRYPRNGRLVEKRFTAGRKTWQHYKVGDKRAIYVHRHRARKTRWKGRVYQPVNAAALGFLGTVFLGMSAFSWIASSMQNGRRRFPENGVGLNAAYRLWQGGVAVGAMVVCGLLAWSHVHSVAKVEERIRAWGSVTDLRVEETDKAPRFKATFQYMLDGQRYWRTERLPPEYFFQLRRGDPVPVHVKRGAADRGSLKPFGADKSLLKMLIGAFVAALIWGLWQPIAWVSFVRRHYPERFRARRTKPERRTVGQSTRSTPQSAAARTSAEAVAPKQRPAPSRPNVIVSSKPLWRFS
jgi:hypothetical protein